MAKKKNANTTATAKLKGAGFQPALAHAGQVSNLLKPPSAESHGRLETRPTCEADQLIAQLEDELRTSREEMQRLIGQLESSNEEMRATNDVARSINEELQLTNEELETSTEELQSMNEELTTVNTQLEAKVGELEATTNDLHNLLASTEIATVFLDQQSCIRRFTPAATRLMPLIPSDIGRPLSDIVLNFDDPDLPADIEAVLASPLQEIQTGDGAWYTRRVLPYRTEDNRVDGVVVTLTDITDRKRAEEVTQRLNVALSQQVAEQTEDLADSERLLRLVLDTVPHYIFAKNREGRYLFVNRFMAEKNGFASPEQLTGAGERESVPEKHQVTGFLHDDRQVINSGQPLFIPAETVTDCTGRKHIVQTTMVPFTHPGTNEPAVLGVSVDITEQKLAEAALHKGQEQFRALFELAAVGISQVDAKGRFLQVNPKLCEMLGYTRDELLGKTVLEVTHPADREMDTASIAQLVSAAPDEPGEDASATGSAGQPAPPFEQRYLRKDGSPLWASVRTTLIHDAMGQPTTAIRVALDLTARRELESQLAGICEEERQRLGREMHDTLGQQITAIGLKATKLHEQLTAESSPHDGQAEALLDMIDEAQQQVRALFKGLLPVEFDAGGLMSALADLADRIHVLHEIDCRFECNEPVPINDSIAAMHLYRIAQEAVHNAVKHSGARKIVIRLRGGSGITLEIRDDGMGLAGNVSEVLDQPADASKPGGAGLRIMGYRARLVGGHLTVVSATPNGTIVECRLPVESN